MTLDSSDVMARADQVLAEHKQERQWSRSHEVADGWDEPAPLPGQASVPTFPVDVLAGIAEYVSAVAEETGTPVDLAALGVLGVCSTLVAGSVVVQGPWTVPANLYLAGIAAPGEGKSPALELCTFPLDRIEAERLDRLVPLIVETQALKRAAEGREADAIKCAAKALPEDRFEAEELAKEAAKAHAEITVPYPPRVFTREATPEGLAKLLAQQGGRLGVVTDEGGEFFELAGRYSAKGKENFGIYLAGWDGMRFASDRAGRDAIVIPRTTMTALLLAQPVVLESLATNREAKGRGLLARFLWARPGTIVGERPVERPSVSETQTRAYEDLMVGLAAEAEAVIGDPLVLRLDSGARDLFTAWHKHHEPRLKEMTGDLFPVVEWANKLPGQAMRLAGNLHALRTGTIHGIVTEDEMAAAVKLAGYFTDHTRHVMGTMQEEPAMADAKSVYKWIVHRNVTEFTTRDVYRSKSWKADRTQEAVRVLRYYGLVRTPDGSEGDVGRPSELWEVYPDLPDKTCQKSPDPVVSSGFVRDLPRPSTVNSNGYHPAEEDTPIAVVAQSRPGH